MIHEIYFQNEIPARSRTIRRLFIYAGTHMHMRLMLFWPMCIQAGSQCGSLAADNRHCYASVKAKRVAEKVRLNSLCICRFLVCDWNRK